MPLAVTSAYRAKHDLYERTPAYRATLTRAAFSCSTHRITGAPSDLEVMELPRGVSAQIEPEKGRASIGSATLTLPDVDGLITALVCRGIGGDKLTLQAGFEDLDIADFATVFTGLVTDYKLTSNLTSYEITAMAPDTLVNRQVFEVAATALNGSISDVATGLVVFDTTFFLAAGYIVIDEEIIQYAGKTATTLTGCTRGALGSTAAVHSDNATVREMLRIGPAHPIDIRLSVLQNTDKTGLSIDPAFIDLATHALVKADLDTSNPDAGDPYLMEFRITARVNAKEFLADQIDSVIACYPITTAGGLLSIKEFRQPTVSGGAETIDHRSILGADAPILSWTGNLSSVINDVTYRTDHDVITGEFKTVTPLSSLASIAKFGKRSITISAMGLRRELTGTATLIQLRAAAFLNRYKDAAPLIECTTILQRGLIEAGDIVRVSSDLIPNRLTLARGVTDSLMEVVGRAANYAPGTVNFTLLWTGFGLASVWAPELTIDFSTATQDLREQYIFWADDAGLNGGMIPGKTYAF